MELKFRRGVGDKFEVVKDETKIVAWARYRKEENYIYMLFVDKEFRWKGIAIKLVRFIGNCVGKKLNRAPSHTKNDAVKALSVKMGEELGEEFRAVSTKRHN